MGCAQSTSVSRKALSRSKDSLLLNNEKRLQHAHILNHPECSPGQVSTQVLSEALENLDASEMVILDATVKPDGDAYGDYVNEHIPGARYLDLTLVRDMASPYPFMMPKEADFVKMMKAMDIRKSQLVIIYETGKGWFATRAAFMMRAFGHPKVLVLDGQFAKWKAEGRPTESAVAALAQDDFDYALDREMVANYD